MSFKKSTDALYDMACKRASWSILNKPTASTIHENGTSRLPFTPKKPLALIRFELAISHQGIKHVIYRVTKAMKVFGRWGKWLDEIKPEIAFPSPCSNFKEFNTSTKNGPLWPNWGGVIGSMLAEVGGLFRVMKEEPSIAPFVVGWVLWLFWVI